MGGQLPQLVPRLGQPTSPPHCTLEHSVSYKALLQRRPAPILTRVSKATSHCVQRSTGTGRPACPIPTGGATAPRP